MNRGGQREGGGAGHREVTLMERPGVSPGRGMDFVRRGLGVSRLTWRYFMQE